MNFLNSTVGGSSLILPTVSKPDPYYAASFSGSNYVVMAGSPGLADQLTGDFSIFAWINTTIISGYPSIFYTGTSTNNESVFLAINGSGQVQCFLWGTAGPSLSVTAADGNWHHVGVVNSGGSFQMWIDGATSGDSQSMSPSLTGNNSFIGTAPGYGNFTGKISEVAIFSRGLSSFDIGNLYNNGLGVFGSTSNPPWNDDLVADYHLNGDFNDYSGNNFNGSPINDVTFATGYIIPPVNIDPSWSTILLDTSRPLTVNLETASGNTGRVHIFKDDTGDADVNNVIILPQSGETIDGVTTKTINTNWESLTLQSDGNNWIITEQNPSNALVADDSGAADLVGQLIGYNRSGVTQITAIGVAGTGATTVGSFGTDTNGLISVWTGTGSGGYGPLAKVTFSTPLPYQPIIQLTAANAYSAVLFGPGQVFVDSSAATTNSFYLVSAGSGYGEFTSIEDNTNYQWYYNVTGSPSPSFESLTAWYSADVLSISYSNNDVVSTWADQSGNGWNLTSSSTYRPTYYSNIQNGLPAVRFTANTNSTYASYMLNNSLGLGPVCTVYVVCRPTTVCDTGNSTTGVNTIFSDAHSTNVTGSIISNNFTIYDGNLVTGSNTISANNNYLFVAVFDEASSQIISNGVLVANGEAGVNDTTSLFIGQDTSFDSPFDGYIMEMLIYSSNAPNASVITYLNNKWKIY